MKQTNNNQKQTTLATSRNPELKKTTVNDAPDFIPGASPYYNLHCFFYRIFHSQDTSNQQQPNSTFQHGK